MSRKVQTKATPSRFDRVITCLGDSLTLNTTQVSATGGVKPRYFYPTVLAKKLSALNSNVPIVARNFGHAGNTTQDMVFRQGLMLEFEVPSIGIIWGGVNDPGNSIAGLVSSTVQASPTPTTTSFSVAAGLGASFVSGQYVYLGTGATMRRAKIASKSTDAFTLANTSDDPALPAAPAAGTVVRQGTQANIEWMIETLLRAGCLHVVVLNTQYLNYASGGDNAGAATYYSAYATLRPFQAAAVATYASTGKVVLCDLWTYMSKIVTNTPSGSNVVTLDTGETFTVTQGDFSWHVASGNQHLNLMGEEVIARAVLDTLQTAGWHNIFNSAAGLVLPAPKLF